MKGKRQEAIERIIAENEVCTQEALQELLRFEGYEVTQATVSRDIKNMELIKVLTSEGKYRYAKSHEEQARKKTGKFHSVFMEAVISVDYAQNIVAVKCHVGMGNAACAALDMMNIGDIVATLAGDDTFFVLMRTTEAAAELVDKLYKILGRQS